MEEINLEETVLRKIVFNKPVSFACKVVDIELNKFDDKNNTYEGKITAIDWLEGFEFTDKWRASPGKEEHIISGRRYHMEIISLEPTVKGFSKGSFTMRPEVDKDFKHYIMHTILDYNPNLQQTKL